MNIEAPIVPGESAAGIQIGSPIEEVLKEDKHSFDSGEREKPWFPTLVKTRYRSAMVDVWAGNGRVIQIMVHSIATKPYDAEKEPTGFMIKQTCERRLVTQIGTGYRVRNVKHLIDWVLDTPTPPTRLDALGPGFVGLEDHPNQPFAIQSTDHGADPNVGSHC